MFLNRYNKNVESVGVNMQVNSVSLNNVESFGSRKYKKDHQENEYSKVIDDLQNASDEDLKKLAIKEASIAVNDKKHKRINNALYWGLPVVGGLAAVVRNPAKAGTFTSARLGNLAKFATTTASWIGTFLLIDGIFAVKNKVSKNSDTVRKFDQIHPIISLGLTIGASIGAVALALTGGSKLANKAIKAVKPETAEKLTKIVTKLDKGLENSKVLNTISKGIDKVPSSLKGLAKGIIDWAPMMMIIGQLSHSFNHAAVKNNVANQNYAELKVARDEARAEVEVAERLAEEDQLPEAEEV